MIFQLIFSYSFYSVLKEQPYNNNLVFFVFNFFEFDT